jgi:hypothetical protein
MKGKKRKKEKKEMEHERDSSLRSEGRLISERLFVGEIRSIRDS